MGTPVLKHRRFVLPGAGRRPWLLAAAIAAAGLGLVAALALSAPPEYAVWHDGLKIAARREPAALGEAVRDWAQLELDRQVILTAGGERWTYSLAELGLVLRPGELAAAAEQSARAVPWHSRFPWSRPERSLEAARTWDRERLEAALAPIRARVERQPVSAQLQIVQHRPSITPEVMGTSIATESVLGALQSLGSASDLAVPVSERPPATTKASLELLGIRRLISEWTTAYDPTIPRAENVERAARAFDGLMLKPGEILSYNATVGPVDEQNGWKPAFVIVDGELVQGIGGGVCQVATTLYGAALRANLDILERHPHQLAVTYIEPSQDAAIAQGWEDLKLRNTTPGHLLIQAESGGGRVTFRLYGDMPAGQEVTVESQVLKSRPYPTRVEEDASLTSGQKWVRMAGNPGFDSEAYRLVHQDGKLVKRELLSRDSYLPTAEVVVTGRGNTGYPPGGQP